MCFKNIKPAEESDLSQILDLQRAAFLSIAKQMNNYEIQPLTQSLQEITTEFKRGIVLKCLSSDGSIIGSVRANMIEENACYIGKLIVHPSFQNQGIGRKLMREVEKYFPDCSKFCLFTSTETPNTLYLYQKLGYEVISKNDANGVEAFIMEKKNNKKFRYATEQDVPVIVNFIKELAVYEDMSDEVVVTEDLLKEALFDHKNAEVLFVLDAGQPVGFALVFHTFSTFLGKPGLFLEDLFVKPEFRKRGYGKSLLTELAALAIEQDCGRFEWCCLDWNQPSIEFYNSLGAEQLTDRRIFRLDREAMHKLVNK